MGWVFGLLFFLVTTLFQNKQFGRRIDIEGCFIMNDGVSIAMRRKRCLIQSHSLKHAAINFFNNLLKLVRKDNRLEFEYVS